MAWEWLTGSWDHFLSCHGHNYFWLKQKSNKWVYIPFDYGEDSFGLDQKPYLYPKLNSNMIDYSLLSLKYFEFNHPIIKILIHNDDTIFRKLLGDMISKIFNPDILFNRINRIKRLISSYIKKDRKTKAGRIK